MDELKDTILYWHKRTYHWACTENIKPDDVDEHIFWEVKNDCESVLKHGNIPLAEEIIPIMKWR